MATAQRAITQAVAAPVRLTPLAWLRKLLTYLFLSFWSVTVVFPMLWGIMSALKSDQEIFFSPWAPPKTLLFENFVRAWNVAQFGAFFVNTLIVLVPALFFTLLLAAMTAYVLARFEFRGRDVIFYMFLGGMMFPIFLGLVPLYLLMQELHLRNTFFGLILVYIAYSLPFSVFFLVGFFKTLPKELPEAAKIDGASQFQTFFRVMLPLAQPGIVPVAIFNVIGMWNQFILPATLLTNEGLPEGQTRYVLSQGLYFLQSQQFYKNDWSALFAAVTMLMIPTLVIYIIFQDRIEKGMTVGAVK